MDSIYSIVKKKIISYNSKTYTPNDVFRLAFVLLCLNTAIAIINSLSGLDYPFNTFLVWPSERFGDLFRGVDGFGIVDVWPGFESNFKYYDHLLPFTATSYYITGKLVQLFGDKYIVLSLFYLVCILATFFVSIKNSNRPSVVFFAICSYPMIFAMDRGNIAIVVFLFLLIAFTTRHIALSTLCIALATSIKLTPVVFVLLLLLDQPLSVKWVIKVMGLLLVWLLIINFISIQFNGNYLSPKVFSLSLLFNGPINSYNISHVNTLQGLGFGSSIFMPLVYLCRKYEIPEFFKSYQVAFFVVAVIGLCLLIKRELRSTFYWLLEKKNMLFVACLAFVLLMPVTADYYLLILLIPLLAFPKTSFSFGYFLCYALILGPKNIFFLLPSSFQGNKDVSLQVFMNPALLLILLFAEFNLLDSVKRDRPITSSKGLGIHFLYFLRDIFLGPQQSINSNPRTTRFYRLIRENGKKGWFWIYSRWRLHMRKIIIVMIIGIAGWIVTAEINMYRIRTRNIERGLPADFDPKRYLELNPGLETFWASQSIKHNSKRELWDHAELHYKGFGAKDGWRYK